MKYNRVVHIGYPKSASTFLQQNVFNETLNYHFMEFHECKKISEEIVINGHFCDIEEIKSHIPSGNIIFSYEGLVGSFVGGVGINSRCTAEILNKMDFNKVIVVTRRDRQNWIESIHNHYVKTGGRLKFSDYIQNPQNTLQMRQWYPEMIEKADEVIDYYKSIFGEENILHLYSEDIFGDKNSFKEEIENFLETEIAITDKKVNESIPGWMVSFLLFTNNFTCSIMNPSTLFKYFSIGYIKKILSLFSSKSTSKF